MSARFAKALAAVALFNGILYFSLPAAYGSEEEDAKKYTLELKKGKDAKTKINALNELGKLAVVMTSLVKAALPDIYAALEDKDAGIRAAAAQCLGACDEKPEKIIPLLVKMLKDDKDDDAKIGAVRGLQAMGPGAKTALPTLRELAGDKKSKLGQASKQAIKAITSK